MNKTALSKMVTKDSYVIVQKIDGEHVRVMRFSAKQKILIEKLKFEADSVFGHPYGLFEVVAGKAIPISSRNIVAKHNADDRELRPESSPTENETCNNQESVQNSKVESTINPAQALQKLTQNDVLGLKSQGVTTGELVAKLVEGNISFNSRTDYAKRKYIRRKTKKHSDRVLIIKPTIRLLAQSYYMKDSERVANLRIDQLGLILQLAGIHYGKRAVVFDQVLGLMTSAVIQRLSGQGACIHLHRGMIAQSIPCIHSMNFDEETLSTFLPVRITYLLGNCEETEGNCVEEVEATTTKDDEEKMETETSNAPLAARREDRLIREQRGIAALEEGVDSLIIAARTVDPVSILEVVYHLLRPCASIVIYGPHMQPILEAHRWLMSHGAINVQLSDQMYRVQQVLPDRTHPLMAQHVVGGIVLSGIKVILPS